MEIDDFNSFNLSIYPNPVKNWINIVTNKLDNATLTIYDISGRVILSKVINGNNNALNVENLSNGTYILQINAGNERLTQQFIKQ